MGTNLFQRMLYKLFCVIFGLLYLWISYLCLTEGQIQPLDITTVLSVTAVVSVICVLFYRFLYRREMRRMPGIGKKNRDMLILMMFFLLYFPLQVYIAVYMYSVPGTSWDFNVVAGHAMDYAGYQGETVSYRDVMSDSAASYFSLWPNNIPLYLLLGKIFRLFAGADISLNAVGIGLNIVAIDIAIAFMYLSVRKATGTMAAAVVSLLLALLHIPMLIYVPIYYTDTLTLPFPIIGFYLWLRVKESLGSEKTGLALVYTSVMAFLLGAGAILKLSVIFFLIASAVDGLVTMKLKKSLLIVAVLLIIGMTVYLAGYQLCLDSDMVVSDKEGCYIPKLHWVMMGLQGKGNYFDPDYQLTLSVPEEARDDLVRYMIRMRIENYGFSGMVKHLHAKIAFVWAEGTYYSSLKIERDRFAKCWLDRYVNWMGDRFVPYAEYCQGLLLINLLMFVVAAMSVAFNKPKRNQLVLVALISIFGLFLFECLWEARSRYIFNYLPVFLTVTSTCAGNILNASKK